MRKIFCDLCGKELTATNSVLNATFLEEENKYLSNLDRALEIRVVMTVRELAHNNDYTEKDYELFSEKKCVLNVAENLKKK